MDELRPEIEFREVIHGRGSFVEEGADEVPVDSFTLSRWKYDHSKPIEFTARYDSRHRPDPLNRSHPVTFLGTTDSGRAIAIRRFHYRKVGGYVDGGVTTAETEVPEVDFGVDVLPPSPSHQHLSVCLTDTDILVPEVSFLTRSYTGEITADDARRDPPFTWATGLGTFKGALHYEYDRATLHESRATVTIRRPTLYLDVPEEARVSDVRAAFDSLAEELRWFLRLLSFLSRRHVDWAVVHLLTHWKEGQGGRFHESDRWHFARPSRRTFLEPLVVPYRMHESSLDDMMKRFQSAPFKESIYLAIGFLLDTFEEGPMEDAVLSVFTALETIVNGITEAEGRGGILPRPAFQELRERLQLTASEFLAGLNAAPSPEMQEYLLGKLGDINRRPVVERVIDVLDTHQVRWRQLWRQGTDAAQELRQAYRRRSILTHTGRVEDYQVARDDCLRIHTLTERLIFKLLGGDEGWVQTEAYY